MKKYQVAGGGGRKEEKGKGRGEGGGERLGFNHLCPFSFFSISNGAFKKVQ